MPHTTRIDCFKSASPSPVARMIAITLLLLVPALGACSPYTLTGRVIEGEASYALLVKPDDPRLQLPGITGASLKLTLDPGKLNRDVVTQQVSDGDGEFALPVDRVGAGLIKMYMGILSRKAGYASSEAFFELPNSGSSRLLIIMAPGSDPPGSQDAELSADDEVRRFWGD
jgi:hypothetical protein